MRTTPGAFAAAATSIDLMRRMRVRRAHEMRMQRAGNHDVVEVAALTGEEAVVLLAQQRLADGAHSAASLRRMRADASITAATML